MDCAVDSAETDATGFYYLPSTAAFRSGATYTVKIVGFPTGLGTSTPLAQQFSWGHFGIVLGKFVVK